MKAWLKKIGTGVQIAIALLGIIAFAIWGWLNRRSAEKRGEEIGKLEESKSRLNEAEKRGDDEGVLEEFRRQTRRRR